MNAAELRHAAEAEDRRDHALKGRHYETTLDETGQGFERFSNFDYDQVDRHLSGEPDAEDLEPTPREFQTAAEMLSVLLRFLSEAATPQSAGLRAWSLVWAIRPDYMSNRWRSVAECCRAFRLTRQALSNYTGDLAKLAPRFEHGVSFKGAAERTLRRQLSIRQHKSKGHVVGNTPEAWEERNRRHRKWPSQQNRKDFNTQSSLIEGKESE